MTLRNFVIASLVFHVIFLSAVWFVNWKTEVEIPEKPLIAKIVPLEEFEPPKKKPPKKVRPPKEIIIPIPKKGLSKKKIAPPEVWDAVPEKKRPRDGEQEGSREGKDKEFSVADLKMAEKKALEDIIEKEGKIAEKEKREEGTGDDDIITFSTKKYKYYGYWQRMEEQIRGILKAPPEFYRGEIYGDLWVRVTILKDGKLGEVKLLRTSGHKILDDAAINALKNGGPYWPLPDKWGENSWTIDINFIYIPAGFFYLR